MRERYWIVGGIAFLLYYFTKIDKDGGNTRKGGLLKPLSNEDITDNEDKVITTAVEMSEAPAVVYSSQEEESLENPVLDTIVSDIEEINTIPAPEPVEPPKQTGIRTQGELTEAVVSKDKIKVVGPLVKPAKFLSNIKNRVKGIFVKKEVCSNEAIINKLEELGIRLEALNTEKKNDVEPVVIGKGTVSPVIVPTTGNNVDDPDDDDNDGIRKGKLKVPEDKAFPNNSLELDPNKDRYWSGGVEDRIDNPKSRPVLVDDGEKTNWILENPRIEDNKERLK